jgi:hypothetical protein
MADLNDLDHDAFLKVLDEHNSVPPLCKGSETVDWLKVRGPDPEFWHYTVQKWNWGVGVDELNWIVRQPACDAATASWVLIVGCGGTLYRSRADCDEIHHKEFDLFSEIANRWRSGFYGASKLGFDPRAADDFDTGVRLYKKACENPDDASLWQLPDAAYGPFTGALVSEADDAVFDEQGVLRVPLRTWYATR